MCEREKSAEREHWRVGRAEAGPSFGKGVAFGMLPDVSGGLELALSGAPCHKPVRDSPSTRGRWLTGLHFRYLRGQWTANLCLSK